MPNVSNAPLVRGSLLAISLAATACGSLTPQGYGVTNKTQDTAIEAQQQLEKAERLTQADPRQTYLGLIRQMQEANQWYASLAHTDAYERQHGSSASIRLLRADAQRNTGQGPEAEKTYQALLSDPDSTIVARARRGIGLLLARQEKYASAIEQLELARQLTPVDADVLSDLAFAHMLRGDLAGARLPVMQAAQLAPQSARVQLNHALYLLASGHSIEANQVLQRLRQPQARNAPPLIDDGSVQTLYSQLDRVRQAILGHTSDTSDSSDKHGQRLGETGAPKAEPNAESGANAAIDLEASPARLVVVRHSQAPASLSRQP